MAQVKPAVAMIDILLRGVGQVMFQNNPITGLLFLADICINSSRYGLPALVGLLVATLAAYLLVSRLRSHRDNVSEWRVLPVQGRNADGCSSSWPTTSGIASH
jgi:urea transporter